MYRKSARYKRLIIGILLIISLVIVFQFKRWTFFSPGRQAKEVVEQFYHYEQEGDFSKSWELFHPVMKEKFTKSNYLQVRAHVFIRDFGVDTFTYKVQKPEELKTWKMSKTGPFMKIYNFTHRILFFYLNQAFHNKTVIIRKGLLPRQVKWLWVRFPHRS